MKTLTTAQLKSVIREFKNKPVALDISTDYENSDSELLFIANLDLCVTCALNTSDIYLLDSLNTYKYDEDKKTVFDSWEFTSTPEYMTEIAAKKLAWIAKAMPTTDVRYYLNGIALYNNGAIAATDGHRIHYSATLHLCDKEEAAKIIPCTAIALSLKLNKKDNFAIATRTKENIATILSNTALIKSKLCDGKFPDIFRVIPKHTTKTYFEPPTKKELGLIATVAKQYSSHESIAIHPDGTIEVPNMEHDTLAKIKLFETSTRMGFKAPYIRDALDTDSSTIHVSVGTANDCVMFETAKGNAVVMPMRL